MSLEKESTGQNQSTILDVEIRQIKNMVSTYL